VTGLSRHAVLLPHTKFRWNRTIVWWVMAKTAFRPYGVDKSSTNLPGRGEVWTVTSVGWQITLCDSTDKWRPVVLRWISRRTIRSFTFYLFQDGGRPPSLILKVSVFGHASDATPVGFNICCVYSADADADAHADADVNACNDGARVSCNVAHVSSNVARVSKHVQHYTKHLQY